MSLRAVVLHLGAHKTGTSLVQKYMRDRPAACKSAGISPMLRGDGDKLIGWGRERELEAGSNGLVAKIDEAEKNGAEYFILSHENALGRPFRPNAAHLYPDVARRAANLKSAIGENQPWRVIYYIRDQASFIESYYLQTIHEGSWNDFDSFVSELGSHGYSWTPVYNALCDLFGLGNVVIRSFDQDMANGQASYLQKFLQSAGVTKLKPFGEFDYNPVRNPSIGDRGLDLARGINPILINTSERRLFRKFLQENFSNQQYPRPVLLSEAAKAEIRAVYRDENKRLLERSAENSRTPI